MITRPRKRRRRAARWGQQHPAGAVGLPDRYRNKASHGPTTCLECPLGMPVRIPGHWHDQDRDCAAAIEAFNARTPAAGPSGWFQTHPTTARKSAPAWTRGAQFSGVMPPMAQQGSSISSDHHWMISGSTKRVTSLVPGGKEGAERHVVGAVLARLHGEIAATLAGDAERCLRTDQRPRLARRDVLLPDMDAIAAGGAHQVGAVVQQERNATRLCHRAQRVDGAPPVVLGDVLQPQLHRRDCRIRPGGWPAGIQRRRQTGRRTAPAPAWAG